MASQEGVSRIFSIRVVTLHYYMAPPIPDFDACYSDFQGQSVSEVLVIRIYGSTLSGQKTCLHVHGVLPYLYVPYALAQSSQEAKLLYCFNLFLLVVSALCTCFCFSNRESFEVKWPGHPLWFISDVAAESPSVASYVGEDVESILYKLLTVWSMTLTTQISHIGWSLLGLHFPSKYYIQMNRKMDIAHA
ncbi:DNA polymerase zeta catalytic subunit [Nymphaea thermarum]|nr:DNA polymerase zeta catalytic subunit [Nymphaea thermarum]